MTAQWSRAVLLVCAAVTVSSCGYSPFDCKPEKLDPAAVVPDSFVVRFETSRGPVDALARKAWSPAAAGRLYALVKANYYDDARFFRVVKGFVAQFGIPGDPKRAAEWRSRCIEDEPVKHSNTRGTISFAHGGANSRSTQLFINLTDNAKLDALEGIGFPPVAEVVSGMDVVDSLYNGYGEAAPRSGSQYGMEGPNQDSIMAQGNAYLQRGWPKLDYIKSARIAREWP